MPLREMGPAGMSAPTSTPTPMGSPAPPPQWGLGATSYCVRRAAQGHSSRGTLSWKSPAVLAGLFPSHRVFMILLTHWPCASTVHPPPPGHRAEIPLEGQGGHHSGGRAGSHDSRGGTPKPSPLRSPGDVQGRPSWEGCRWAPDSQQGGNTPGFRSLQLSPASAQGLHRGWTTFPQKGLGLGATQRTNADLIQMSHWSWLYPRNWGFEVE